MKVLIAPDSFKGSLSAIEVAQAIAKGIKKANSEIETLLLPIADGGEGTVETLLSNMEGKPIECEVDDPLNRKIKSFYGILNHQHTAIIEIAAASGLILLNKAEQNPLITNTYGTGELIKHALDQGCRNFIIGLGGSATNDAGYGMAKALGFKFLDKDGNELALGGEQLLKLHYIDSANVDPRIKESTFVAACDVKNPLCGINGASIVYGKQKGASLEECEKLDKALFHFSEVIKNQFNADILNIAGAGAAGGLGAGVIAFLNAKLQSGVDIIIDKTQLNSKLKDIDLIITGEGKMDKQTTFGKAPLGIAKLAKQNNIPLIAICGSLGDNYQSLYQYGFQEIYPIMENNMTLEYAITHTKALIEAKSEQVINLINQKIK